MMAPQIHEVLDPFHLQDQRQGLVFPLRANILRLLLNSQRIVFFCITIPWSHEILQRTLTMFMDHYMFCWNKVSEFIEDCRVTNCTLWRRSGPWRSAGSRNLWHAALEQSHPAKKAEEGEMRSATLGVQWCMMRQ